MTVKGTEVSSRPAPSKEFVDYTGLIRRRWGIVLCFAVLVLAGVGAYTFTLAKTYTAEAQVLVAPTGFDDSAPEASKTKSDVNLDTEAQVAKSLEVAKEAKRLLKYGDDENHLLAHVAVSVPPNSGVLTIAFTDDTPRAAANGANLFAQAYLNQRTASAQANLQRQMDVISKKIQELSEENKVLLDRIPRYSGAARTYARSQQAIISRQITELTGRLGSLSTSSINPGRIISNASTPTRPSGPNVPLYLTGGLMAGLLVGLGAGAVRDRLDTRLRSAADVERMLDMPVLLELHPAGKGDRLGLLPARSRNGQEVHELSHQLNAVLGHGNHVILVTSATDGPGAGLSAANLAAALARTQSRVALVCADLHSRESARLTEAPASVGLAEVLLGKRSLRNAMVRSPVQKRLWVVPPGIDTELAYELLQTRQMVHVVDQLRANTDYVVIDAPSTSSSADAQAIAEAADTALVVVEVPDVRRKDVEESVRALDRMSVAVLGTLVVPAQPHSTARPQPRRAPRPAPGAASSAAGSPGGPSSGAAASGPNAIGGVDLEAFGDGPADRTLVDPPGDRAVAGPRRGTLAKPAGDGDAEHRAPANGSEPDTTSVIPRFSSGHADSDDESGRP
ncbi:Wzz/FepE/Etk N-terminal domain-containing protein [Actinomadura soli]|uniref:Wzz/FepE/Etk N-terminal domain-containing protein n=1 Tax=Actinomadura soli TaxID=2508997 RepID=UPI002E313441|nr:Wzz/FepE/Etk N-terminal domain-containing protein [Actinomadura soli]